jgi:cyclophilin family peptidyl-prolyl cis-trans isomerase
VALLPSRKRRESRRVSGAAAGCYAVLWRRDRAGPAAEHIPGPTQGDSGMKRMLLLALFAGLLGAVPARAANPVVVMETSMGTIKIELYPEKAPITVKNFLGYVDDKFYDDTIFHRVMGKENTDKMEDFMIQGGGFTKDHKEKKTKEQIKNESNNGLSNKRGTIAMARLRQPDTASAQFYINVKDNDFLDGRDQPTGYTVFGKVIEGMDVVDKIKAVKTGEKKFTVPDPRDPTKTVETTFENVPQEDLVIKSVRVEKPK